MRNLVCAILYIFVGLTAGTVGFARDLYVSPGAAGGGDGSRERPFADIAAAFETSVGAGDQVLLAPGDYGAVRISGLRTDPPVRLAVVPGADAAARLASLRITDTSGLEVEGLLVEGGSGGPHVALVTVEANSTDVTLRRLTVRSGPGHESWDAATWRARARRGFMIKGARVTLRDSRISGVRHGIIVRGRDARVVGNLIDGFSGDGMRGLGDGGLFEGNGVQNCVKVDENHDDGFQSWSEGPDGKSGRGVVRGVTVRGNSIRAYAESPGPLSCRLMGISLFDGMFADWLIEGNVVEVDALNGIVVLGGENVRVLNNVVRNLTPGADRLPQITISAHKDGRPGNGNLIAGNQAVLINTGQLRKMITNPRATVVRDNLRLLPTR